VVVALAALTVLGAVIAASRAPDEHQTKIQFVMRPDVSVSNHDLPAALDALKSDGPLVQTIIGVLGSQEILRRAAADADVPLSSDYSIESTARPSSTVIDSTVTGPDRKPVDRLADGYARAASNYVATSYSAYVLERLSTDRGAGGAGPSAAQVVILALLVGTGLGVALVAAELRLKPQLGRLSERPAAARAARSSAGDSDRPTRPAVPAARPDAPDSPAPPERRAPREPRPRQGPNGQPQPGAPAKPGSVRKPPGAPRYRPPSQPGAGRQPLDRPPRPTRPEDKD
jgi:hypothetical protein